MKLPPPRDVGVAELGAVGTFLVSSVAIKAAPVTAIEEGPIPSIICTGREKVGSSWWKATRWIN